MTECNGLPLLFASLGRKKVMADFQGGDLTSDGGLPLLREVDRKSGLIDALDAAIYDPRFQPLVVHEQRTILARTGLGHGRRVRGSERSPDPAEGHVADRPDRPSAQVRAEGG